jgi:hypothetical protein
VLGRQETQASSFRPALVPGIMTRGAKKSLTLLLELDSLDEFTGDLTHFDDVEPVEDCALHNSASLRSNPDSTKVKRAL